MNALTIVGLLCTDDTFRRTFFENQGVGLDETLKRVPLLLSGGEKLALMALADNGEVAEALAAAAAAMRRIGCPQSPCPFGFYGTLNPPQVPPPPNPAA